jgi:uncharacterized protein (TIGR04255 family)
MTTGYKAIRKTLSNKPLVEAIFELRWTFQEVPSSLKLQDGQSNLSVDPYYSLLIGALYERLKDRYPFHEQLPTASIPSDVLGHVVQHRFRAADNKWPLVQVGPGVVTLNDTESYIWEDFEERIWHLITTLYESHPDAQGLETDTLILRYIDAIPFHFENDDIFGFLREQMQTSVDLPQGLFEVPGINRVPSILNLHFAFPVTQPLGTIHLRLQRGKRGEEDALILETVFAAGPEEAPRSLPDIRDWLRGAHEITGFWFFKLISGDLLRRFL